jgi:hypothetical protein
MSSMLHDSKMNHRRMKRQAAKKSIAVTCRKGTLGFGPNLAIRLNDVSVDGAQVFVTTLLKLGDELELTFSPPGFAEPLVQMAVVAWCSAREGNGYRIGVKFTDSLSYQDIYHMT